MVVTDLVYTRPVMQRFLREPILHFLLAGIVLYALAMHFRGDELLPENDKLITVDRDALLNFMQFRANIFDASLFEQTLAGLTAGERDALVQQFVNEEVLYREAKALGLEQSDYIIRSRMVEKMQFLLGDLAGVESTPAEGELVAYFEENSAAYLVKPAVTFTHVFFDAGIHGADQAHAQALSAQSELNARSAGFNDADGVGDRYPFLRNYVERTVEYVEGHFGTDFAAALSQLQSSDALWQGPIESEYGWHLVMLTSYSAERKPELEEVRRDVQRDYIQERGDQLLKDMVESVKAQYEVQIAID